MDALSMALLISLGGSFLTVWLTNLVGGRLEVAVQRLSHTWIQWPQRVFMSLGILTFVLIGVNYYFVQTYDQDIFTLLRSLPLIENLEEPLRWFFSEIGAEMAYVWEAMLGAPKNTPLLTIVFSLLTAYIFMSIFDVNILQKLLVTLVIGATMYFFLRGNFVERRTQDQRDYFSPISQISSIHERNVLSYDQESGFHRHLYLYRNSLVYS